MIESNRPLVTLAFLAYNQEKFIREAVESVLAQDYSPLEIILSDDCSTDKTFEIMESLVKNYRGFAKIRLNQNPKNLGVIAHLDKLMEMANGEFIVGAAGDDISIPQRTQILVDHWISVGKTACSIFTNAITINNDSEPTGYFYNAPPMSLTIDQFIENQQCWVGGFSHGFSKELYTIYGPITEETFQEDGALSFRALLNSGIYYLETTTVFYRRHSGNSFAFDSYPKFKRLIKSELGLARGRLDDLKKNSRLTDLQYAAVERLLKKQIRFQMLLTNIPGAIETIFLARQIKAWLGPKLFMR